MLWCSYLSLLIMDPWWYPWSLHWWRIVGFKDRLTHSMMIEILIASLVSSSMGYCNADAKCTSSSMIQLTTFITILQCCWVLQLMFPLHASMVALLHGYPANCISAVSVCLLHFWNSMIVFVDWLQHVFLSPCYCRWIGTRSCWFLWNQVFFWLLVLLGLWFDWNCCVI